MKNYKLPELQSKLVLLQNNFWEFLRTNNVLEAFCSNIDCGINASFYFWELIGNYVYYPVSWVRCGFVWKNSNEGQEFWKEIDIMWLEQLEKDNEI